MRAAAIVCVVALLGGAGSVAVTAEQVGALSPLTERVSVSSSGAEGVGASIRPSVSDDGRFVAFESKASSLVASDTNGVGDVFVRDRVAGTTERVSINSSSEQADGLSDRATISSNGRFVAFDSQATNLVPGGVHALYVYVRDRETGETSRVSVPSQLPTGANAFFNAISSDGRFVVFMSQAVGAAQIYEYDRALDATTLVSATPSGAPSAGPSGFVYNGLAVSADGRFVAFASDAADLVVGDSNGHPDVYLRDVAAATTTRISQGVGGAESDGTSVGPVITGDGRFIAFDSDAVNLVTGTVFPTQGSATRSYVRDRVTGETKLVSVQSDGGAAPGNVTDVSDDGRFVLLETDSSSVVPYPPGCTVTIAGSSLPCSSISGVDAPIVVRDLHRGTSERVSVNTSGEPAVRGSHAATTSSEPRMTADGSKIVFSSDADNLVSGDTNGSDDVFVRERDTSEPPDSVPPTVSVTTPTQGALYVQSQLVAARYSCSDAPGGSGLASCVGTLPDGALIDTSVGSHTFSVTATDYTGNSTTQNVSYDVVDVTAPTVVMSSPLDAATYTPGQSVLASYSCDDEVDGSGLASCSGTVASGSPIDTSTPGTGVFEVTATDNAGNATHLIRHYTVGSPGPVVAIYSPRIEAQYAAGQVVNADFSCSPAPGGAAVASCVGTVPAGQPVDTGFGIRSFSVVSTDVLGRETIENVQYRMFVLTNASETLPPGGGTVITNDTPTRAAPFGTVVTSPNGGLVSIVDQVQAAGAPTGYTALGAQVLITAPAATPENPLVLTFYGEGSALPWGIDQSNIALSKDGALLPNCLGATTVPVGLTACISGRDPAPSGGGDIRITVISVSASSWSFEAPLPTIVAGHASVAEGNSGTRTLTVPITLNRATARRRSRPTGPPRPSLRRRAPTSWPGPAR